MEEPRQLNSLKELDAMFPKPHNVEILLAKIQKKITLQKPRLMKTEGSKINQKNINQELLYNLENKISPKFSQDVANKLEIIISELDFNNYERAFERLMELIKEIEDSV